MQPSPELSNHAVIVATGDGELSCFARPRHLRKTFVATAVGMTLASLPLLYLGPSINRFMDRGYEPRFAVDLLLCGTPLLLAIGILLNVLIRLHRPRGFTIQLGIVTVLTPDDPVASHVFELNNLKGATLARSFNSNAVDLHFERRRGMSITVLRSYEHAEIGHLVDHVNRMVTDDRSFAFEVIPLGRPAQSPQEAPAVRPLPVRPEGQGPSR